MKIDKILRWLGAMGLICVAASLWATSCVKVSDEEHDGLQLRVQEVSLDDFPVRGQGVEGKEDQGTGGGNGIDWDSDGVIDYYPPDYSDSDADTDADYYPPDYSDSDADTDADYYPPDYSDTDADTDSDTDSDSDTDIIVDGGYCDLMLECACAGMEGVSYDNCVAGVEASTEEQCKQALETVYATCLI